MKQSKEKSIFQWIISVLPWVIMIPLVAGIYLQPQFVFHLLYPEQTVYADGYTKEKWASIRQGMNREEVIKILGWPLTINECGIKGEEYRVTHYNKDGFLSEESYYSNVHPPGDYAPEKIEYSQFIYSRAGHWVDSYYVRALKIDKNGKVIEIHSEYYWD